MVTVWHATLNMSRQGHHHIFFLVNTHKLGHIDTYLCSSMGVTIALMRASHNGACLL